MSWHGKVHLAVVEQMVEEAELELADHSRLLKRDRTPGVNYPRKADGSITNS
jgi:hypothetical protein